MDNGATDGIRLSSLIHLFFSKLWIMLLVAIIAGASVFAVKYFSYVPVYKSTASIYILRQNPDAKDTDYKSDFSLALSAVSDCTTLLKSRAILSEVISENSLPYSYEELYSMVTVTSPENSRYLEVSVRCEHPQEAKNIADSICTLGKKKLVNLMGFDQVNIIEPATMPKEPNNAVFSYMIFFGAFAAFILTYSVLVIVSLFDDKIESPDDIERYLGLTVLGIIPDTNKPKKQTLIESKSNVNARHYR